MKKYRWVSEERLEALIEERGRKYAEKLNQDYEREILKRQVYMAALQNQINPHFLYNSLECIRGQALLYDVPEIADTTQALSKFFRYSINTKSDVVTLREELDNVRDYMKIQQYRFKERFYLTISYDESEEEILQSVLPKLTLQPIVENALVHGFSNKTKHNNIVIEVKVTRLHLSITVSDDGKGMDEETLKVLNQKLLRPPELEEIAEGRHHGIAMGNVNRRLKLFFGEEYGMNVSSAEGMGTDVEIYIPIQR